MLETVCLLYPNERTLPMKRDSNYSLKQTACPLQADVHTHARSSPALRSINASTAVWRQAPPCMTDWSQLQLKWRRAPRWQEGGGACVIDSIFFSVMCWGRQQKQGQAVQTRTHHVWSLSNCLILAEVFPDYIPVSTCSNKFHSFFWWVTKRIR